MSKALLLVVCCLTGVVLASSETNVSDGAPQASEIDATEINRILALSDDVEYGEYLAGECASCHAVEQVAGSSVPVIHGAEAAHLVQSLLEYRIGVRDNTTMQLIANGLGEEEIAVLAHYLSNAGG